jgi:hypothetical protein
MIMHEIEKDPKNKCNPKNGGEIIREEMVTHKKHKRGGQRGKTEREKM